MIISRQAGEQGVRVQRGASDCWRLPGAAAGTLALVLGFLLAGCMAQATGPEPHPLVSVPRTDGPKAPEPDVVAAAYTAADVMVNQAQQSLLPHLPIVPTSFVMLDNLDETSTLGRLLALQMANRFTQRGYAVTEVKLRKNLLIKKGDGEFALTRDLALIRKEHNIQAVLAGNYVLAHDTLYVSAQLVRAGDGRVLATVDYTLPLSKNTRSLLGLPRPRE